MQRLCLPLTILNMQILGTVHSVMSGSICLPMEGIDMLGAAGFPREFRIQRMYATPPLVYDLLTRDDVDPDDIVTPDRLGVGRTKAPKGLDAACRSELARYKVPVAWYVVESFPQNAMTRLVCDCQRG